MMKTLTYFSSILCLFVGALAFADTPSYRMIAPDGSFRVEIAGTDGQGGLIGKLQPKKAFGEWENISDEILGVGSFAAPEDGWVRLIVGTQCGWQFKNWNLYRYSGKKYICVRREHDDYKPKAQTILDGGRPYKSTSYPADLYRIEKQLRLALDSGHNEDQWLEVIYPDKNMEQSGGCTFKYAVDDDVFLISVLPQSGKGCMTIYGVHNGIYSNSTLGIARTFGAKIHPERKAKVNRAINGTFTLWISNQTFRKGDAPELTIEVDGKPFAKEKILPDRKMLQHTYYSYPTSLADGKHTLKITGGGIDFEQEFTVNKDNDIGVFLFTRPSWYEFWKNPSVHFETRKGPLLWL